MWVYLGAAVWACLTVTVALVAGGSWLPLALQIALAAITLMPWIPGLKQRWLSWGFVAMATIPTLIFTWTGGSPVLFAVLALSCSRVAISTPPVQAVSFGVLAVGIVVGRQFIADYDLNWMIWKTYMELGVALGWAMRSRRLLVVRTREARDEHAQLAALEERRRIARDVHDVLAHTLTILMVHLNSARLSVREDPDGTAALLDEVAAYGRYCLEDIRSTVGLLSSPATGSPSSPIEAANAIEELADSYRKVGVDVDLRLEVGMEHMGRLSQAPPAMWHSGYRIVQESLANATKHAPGSPIEINIGVDDAGLHIQCVNPVSSGIVMLELPSGGNGVNGMHERATAMGGSFSAGLEGSNWLVRANLPLTPDDSVRRHAETLGWAS
jgi:signal transduction histidine kinase